LPEIQSAADYSTAQLLDVTNDAFSDYAVPMKQTLQGFETFLRQRGVVLPRSFVMVEGNDDAEVKLIAQQLADVVSREICGGQPSS